MPILVLPFKVVLHQKVQQLFPLFFHQGSCFCKISHSFKSIVQTHQLADPTPRLLQKKKVFSCLFLQLGFKSLSLCSLYPAGLFNLTNLRVFFPFDSVQLRKPSYSVSILIFDFFTNTQTSISRSAFGEAANAVVDAVPHSACSSLWVAQLRLMNLPAPSNYSFLSLLHPPPCLLSDKT